MMEDMMQQIGKRATKNATAVLLTALLAHGCSQVATADDLITSEQRVALANIQQRLVERGVQDIKFHWLYEASTPRARAADMIVCLSAVLEGKHKPFTGLGDSQMRKETEG